MIEVNCENVCVAAMAIADGEVPPLPVDKVEAHLVTCENCRLDVEHLLEMTKLLDVQKRRQPSEKLWPMVERHLMGMPRNPKAPLTSRLFLFLGIFLSVYKAILMLAEHDVGIGFKFIPVLVVVAVFSYLKENPLKINGELRLEGE
jgi:predicted anti-sigma-YlaC factor YlaD